MELRHLRYFLAIAEELNFTRAAEKLHIAQPALSRQIRDLEHEIGTRLFERGGTKTALTPAGQAFVEGARNTLAAAAAAVSAARDASAASLGTFRVGYMHPHFDELIPQAIADFRLRYPKIKVVPLELNPLRQAEALVNDEIDLGLLGLATEAERRGLMHEPFTPAISYAAVLPKGHRLLKKKEVDLQDLEGESIIPISPKTFPGATERVAKQLRDAGVNYTLLPAAETSTSILGQVASGIGIAVIPVNLRSTAPKSLTFKPLNIGTVIQYEAAWKAERFSPVLADFLQILRRRTGLEIGKAGPGLGLTKDSK